MNAEHLARRPHSPEGARFESSQRHTVARYETELAKQQNRLREALAREAALRRRNDELVQQQDALTELFAGRADAVDRVASLTPRQRQIMELVLAGHPSKNIAADLGISRRTVENHRHSIMKRTGTKSLPALARLALGATWEAR
jgi:FixJ family two-component response regulator